MDELEKTMSEFTGRNGREYSLEQLTAMSVGENWSNDACKGYVALAMKELKFRDKDIEPILDALDDVFDLVSVREAAAYYQQR